MVCRKQCAQKTVCNHLDAQFFLSLRITAWSDVGSPYYPVITGRARTARLQVIETCRKLKKGEWLTQADTVSRRGPVLAIQPSRQNLRQEPEKQKPGTEPRDEYLPARNSNTADEATG
jgi:hypothetical protein